MTTLRFNAITYANKLKNAGLSSSIADVEAEEISNLINNDLSTKQDVKDLEIRIVGEIKNLKNEMTIKLGSMMVIGMAVLGFILKH